MPCTYYLPGEEAAIARRELDKATRAACEALGMLETLSLPHMKGLSSKTLVWWKEHKERDALRKARKPKKVSAKKKAARQRAAGARRSTSRGGDRTPKRKPTARRKKTSEPVDAVINRVNDRLDISRYNEY